jgi:hypothetical protein
MKKILLYSAAVLIAIGAFVWVQVIQSPDLSAQTIDENVLDNPLDLLSKGYRKRTVTIKVKDDRRSQTRVESAALEDQEIRVHKKANFWGEKGKLSTKLAPGTYTLRWTVTKPARHGDRITLSFQRSVRVKNRDITVVIEGQNARTE